MNRRGCVRIFRLPKKAVCAIKKNLTSQKYFLQKAYEIFRKCAFIPFREKMKSHAIGLDENKIKLFRKNIVAGKLRLSRLSEYVKK